IRGGGNGEQGRLRVLGELELLFGSFEAEAGEGQAERIVGLLKDPSRGGVRTGQSLAHPSELGSLAGEEKCGCRCQRWIITVGTAAIPSGPNRSRDRQGAFALCLSLSAATRYNHDAPNSTQEVLCAELLSLVRLRLHSRLPCCPACRPGRLLHRQRLSRRSPARPKQPPRPVMETPMPSPKTS